MQKRCTECNMQKDDSEFYLNRGRRVSKCKECLKSRASILYKKDKESKRQYANEYRGKNREKIADYLATYNAFHREERKQRDTKNKKRIKDNLYEWKRSHSQKLKEYQRNYREKNKERLSESRRRKGYRTTPSSRKRHTDYLRNRRRADFSLRVTESLRNRLYVLLRRNKARKDSSAIALLGCSLNAFLKHLESQFSVGMTWENYGRQNGKLGWDIDHIIPCSAFDLTKPEQQIVCFHFENLRPMWARDNYKKGGIRRKR